MLYADLEDRLTWFDAYDQADIDLENAERCKQKVAQRAPWLLDEIQRFVAALNISYERYLPYFLFDREIHSQCSQFCVLLAITRDGKVYSGHNGGSIITGSW